MVGKEFPKQVTEVRMTKSLSWQTQLTSKGQVVDDGTGVPKAEYWDRSSQKRWHKSARVLSCVPKL